LACCGCEEAAGFASTALVSTALVSVA
jgi:hypothetical protein